jgi:hypothetical protein
MKIPKLTIFLLLLFWLLYFGIWASGAKAEEVHWNSKEPEWTWIDTTLAVIAVGINVYDWHQTLGAQGTAIERNPFLGEHPSRGAINIYFPVYTAAMASLIYFLPEHRRFVFGTWIGVEGATVVRNAQNGY